MPPKVGYIGLDHHHCGPYLQSLAQLPVEVTCAAAPTAEIDPADLGLADVPLYRDTDTLLATEDIDIAWLTLPNRDTPDAIEVAAEYDIDVYTEKPAARTASELTPIVKQVGDANTTVCVSYTWRNHPIACELTELADEDFFGSVQSIAARFVASQLRHRDTNHYLFDKEASRGGILQWLGVHWVDLIPWILDDPIVRVNAQFTSMAEGIAVEDGAMLQLETESGAFGTLQCGYYLREGRYDTRIDIYGTDGQSSWDPIGQTFGFDERTELELEAVDDTWVSAPRRTTTYEYKSAPGYGGRWGIEFMEQFLAARNDNTPVPASLNDAVRVLQVLDAAYESHEKGNWVAIDS